jgi:hypothetical protein
MLFFATSVSASRPLPYLRGLLLAWDTPLGYGAQFRFRSVSRETFSTKRVVLTAPRTLAKRPAPRF